ncbi:MAG: hypothetical protein AVDCRST_MAG87-2340 [uncultured Thermomicrobiales bacterium]|uniref:Uncharacterized protein n=1 Tax=uncultured Thermomicrobiales bacterium TaxID=1645740 RepID=A0A6J4V6Q2_9BACT|nr:MAG: hypothetical protein AVDCRST_MAG87-2340 [uncultured Thermomicrobiales bacterium]
MLNIGTDTRISRLAIRSPDIRNDVSQTGPHEAVRPRPKEHSE